VLEAARPNDPETSRRDLHAWCRCFLQTANEGRALISGKMFGRSGVVSAVQVGYAGGMMSLRLRKEESKGAVYGRV
jgi:hypothetical protein